MRYRYPFLAMTSLLIAIMSIFTPHDFFSGIFSDKIHIWRDVAYGQYPYQKLDIYVPPFQQHRTLPVIVYFYGGGWHKGDKKQSASVGKSLAALGAIVVVPNYRLYPEVSYPEFLYDNADAVVWTHRSIKNYGGAAARLYLMGHSAGAYNSAMLALNPDYLARSGGDVAWIKGVIGLAGPYAFLPLEQRKYRDVFGPEAKALNALPIGYVRKSAPPMLLLTGANDVVVPSRHSRLFYEALKEHGNDVVYKAYPNLSHHGIIKELVATSPGMQVRGDVRKFLKERNAFNSAQ